MPIASKAMAPIETPIPMPTPAPVERVWPFGLLLVIALAAWLEELATVVMTVGGVVAEGLVIAGVEDVSSAVHVCAIAPALLLTVKPGEFSLVPRSDVSSSCKWQRRESVWEKLRGTASVPVAGTVLVHPFARQRGQSRVP